MHSASSPPARNYSPMPDSPRNPKGTQFILRIATHIPWKALIRKSPVGTLRGLWSLCSDVDKKASPDEHNTCIVLL
eukprot:5779636-Amphidinium_carterae.1